MKTPGQVAYEAMLPFSRAVLDREPTEVQLALAADPVLLGEWQAQTQQLRDSWESVAQAVLAECCDLERPR